MIGYDRFVTFRGPLTTAIESRLGLLVPLTDAHLAPLLAAPGAALPVPTFFAA